MTQFQAEPDVVRMCLYVEYVNKLNKLYINIYTKRILTNAAITINDCEHTEQSFSFSVLCKSVKFVKIKLKLKYRPGSSMG